MSDALQPIVVSRPPIAPVKLGRGKVRRAATVSALVGAFRDLVRAGIFHPKTVSIAHAAATLPSMPVYLFGSKTGLGAHVALEHAGEIVGELGLSPAAMLALSPRDERAIAMAILAGRRLGAGE